MFTLLGSLLFNFYGIFNFHLKISLKNNHLKIHLKIILHPFKPIPTRKVVHCLGRFTYAKGLTDDGQVKAVSRHAVGLLLGVVLAKA